MMINENYNLYVVACRSYLLNCVTVYGVFPNERLARQFKSLSKPKSEIFVIKPRQLLFGECGLEIPIGGIQKIK